MRNLYIVAFAILLIACKEEKKSSNSSTNIQKVKMDKNSNTIETILADSIFDSVSYIKLETNEKNLIHTIAKIMIDKMVYVLDSEQSVIYVFDKNGKSMGGVNKRGAGPEEYLSIDDFSIDSKYIYILSRPNQSIYIYGLTDFRFIKVIKLGGMYSQFIKLENLLYLYGNFQLDDLNNIAVYDIKESRIVSKYKKFPKEQLYVGCNNYVFVNKDDTVFATFPYEYSIFKLNPRNIENVATFDFGKEFMFPEELRQASSDDRKKYLSKMQVYNWPIPEIYNVIVTNSHYIFSFIFLGSNFTLFKDRYRNTHKFGYIMQSEKYPLVTPFLFYYEKGQIIQCVDSENIVRDMRSDSSVSIPNNLHSVKIDDNPVIAIYSLKRQYQ